MDHRRRRGEGSPGWSWRRALVLPLIVYACYRLSMMEMAADTRVNETIAWGWIVIIISCVFFYTGFASAQDIAAILATRSGLPYADPPQYYQQTQTTTATTVPVVSTSEPVLDEPGPGARP
jgi:hypothetical protein